MVSASRAGSSMLATCISISGGMRLLSLTKASKTECTRAHQRLELHGLLARLLDLLHLDHEERRRWAGTSSRCARRTPSTSTFTVPSGSGSSWMTWPMVPKWKMSSGVGSFVLAFFWAARRMTALSSGALVGHRVLQRRDGLLPADEQRDHHVRKHDDVPQREQRNGAPTLLGILLVVSSEEHVFATCLLATLGCKPLECCPPAHRECGQVKTVSITRPLRRPFPA